MQHLMQHAKEHRALCTLSFGAGDDNISQSYTAEDVVHSVQDSIFKRYLAMRRTKFLFTLAKYPLWASIGVLLPGLLLPRPWRPCHTPLPAVVTLPCPALPSGCCHALFPLPCPSSLPSPLACAPTKLAIRRPAPPRLPGPPCTSVTANRNAIGPRALPQSSSGERSARRWRATAGVVAGPLSSPFSSLHCDSRILVVIG